MERKKFIKTSGTLLTFPFFTRIGNADNNLPGTIIPPYLQKNDTIGITSPSGHILLKQLMPAIRQIESWGLKIETGNTIGLRDGTFGGSDEERAADFQQMLNARHIKAILCARGGYGALRIIDKIDFSAFRQNPKWIIGFSDATVFHSHIATNCQVATLHSKMCNSFPDNWLTAPSLQQHTILSIRDALMNTQKMRYTAPYNSHNKSGVATAEMIGGNLRTIENLSGTHSAMEPAGKILFIEETQEYLYNIDRMLWNLKRSDRLSRLQGLIIGGFNIKQQPVPADELNLSLYDLVLEKTKNYRYPVCFDFPVGHQVNNFALKCGVRHQLNITKAGTALIEV